MPSVDLYSHSTNPSPAQLIKVCDDLLSKLVFNQNTPPAVEFLKDAEALAEQILGHYESLSALAGELRGLFHPDSKLPYQVLNVFMYAGVREHPSFPEIIRQLDELYGDEKDQRALAAMSGMTQDNYLMMVPKPALWGKDGRLNITTNAVSTIIAGIDPRTLKGRTFSEINARVNQEFRSNFMDSKREINLGSRGVTRIMQEMNFLGERLKGVAEMPGVPAGDAQQLRAQAGLI